MGDLPKLKKVQAPRPADTPEELFKILPRSKSHGYLRGEQQDVLRDFASAVADPEIALELPTGTGKTCVGLLIAEWRRRSGQRVAYLSLTNQLAAQALEEARALGIPAADVRGNRSSRHPDQESRFLLRKAVGISTYANLFNTNPVVRDCETLVLDDAHGGEQKAAEMWTVTVAKEKNAAAYHSLLTALRPAMSNRQASNIFEGKDYELVELIDARTSPECLASLRELLESDETFKFVWPAIANHLNECLFLASPHEASVRPLIPPTWSHAPFSGAKQRVYMSATLGGAADLQRAYGITSPRVICAKKPQSGDRFIFTPGLLGDQSSTALFAKVWARLDPRRALLIAPSAEAADAAFSGITAGSQPAPLRFGASDIENDLQRFTAASDAMLVLAGRYDGVDLPDDDCRLLVLAGRPQATNALERHLIHKWKMGPALSLKEITRLTQGLGRCTRAATDFAIVLLYGKPLTDWAASTAASRLPTKNLKEIKWGVEQADGSDVETMASLILGLLTEPEYRTTAAELIAEVQVPDQPPAPGPATAGLEVQFARALWEGDYREAHRTARAIADSASQWNGYRGWWWYMASVAAGLSGDTDSERDCLTASLACRVNTPFLSHLLAKHGAAVPPNDDAELAAQIWSQLDRWGWRGPSFDAKIDEMKIWLGSEKPGDFHRGLARLGEFLGAVTDQLAESGRPDCVWYFGESLYACFEAKTQKNAQISKKDLLQTKGHLEWVKHHRPGLQGVPSAAIIIAAMADVANDAKPFRDGVHHLTTDDVKGLAERVAAALSQIRAKFSGRDLGECQAEFVAELSASKLDLDSTKLALLSKPLGSRA